MRVTVVRHHEEDGPGLVGESLEERGAGLDVHLYPEDGDLPDAAGSRCVVVLGASWSVYDDGPLRPIIDAELEWLRRLDAAGVPVLGICFGAQLLAAAHGGWVERSVESEVGWVRVEAVGPDPGDHESPDTARLRAALDGGPWFQFHGDRCVLPPTARLLARNRVCAQAFSVGRAVGVQFHPEVDAAQLGRWLGEGGRAAVQSSGQDPDELLAATASEEAAARRRSAALVGAFLGATVG